MYYLIYAEKIRLREQILQIFFWSNRADNSNVSPTKLFQLILFKLGIFTLIDISVQKCGS